MLICFEHICALNDRVNFPEYGNSECVSLGEIQITSSHHNGDHDRHRSSRHRRSRSRSDSRDRNREGRGDGDVRGGSLLDMDSKVLYNKVSRRSVCPDVNTQLVVLFVLLHIYTLIGCCDVECDTLERFPRPSSLIPCQCFKTGFRKRSTARSCRWEGLCCPPHQLQG